MRCKIAVGLVAGLLGSLGAVASASAGQPGDTCPTTGTTPPPGFSTAGFQGATLTYAGAANNPASNAHAVSQYDVACFGGRAK
jgi:hypothetical protein